MSLLQQFPSRFVESAVGSLKSLPLVRSWFVTWRQEIDCDRWTLTGSSNRDIAFLKVRGSYTVPFLTPPLRDLCLSGRWQGLYLRFVKTHATMRLDYVLECTYRYWFNCQQDRKGLCGCWLEREYSLLPSHNLCILYLNHNPTFRSQRAQKRSFELHAADFSITHVKSDSI